MGVNYNSSIDATNLVVCLDTANPRSYTGSGSSVLDASGNTNNCTLFNTPTFSSDNGGYLLFNGSTQYGTFSVPAMTSYSLGFWLYVVSLPASGEEQVLGAPSDIVSISLLFSGGSWKWHSWIGSSRIGNTVNTGVWQQFFLTRAGSTTNFYVNGALDSTFNSGADISSGTAYLFDINGSGVRALNARLSNLTFYSRELSLAEVQRTFNARRGRYGL